MERVRHLAAVLTAAMLVVAACGDSTSDSSTSTSVPPSGATSTATPSTSIDEDAPFVPTTAAATACDGARELASATDPIDGSRMVILESPDGSVLCVRDADGATDALALPSGTPTRYGSRPVVQGVVGNTGVLYLIPTQRIGLPSEPVVVRYLTGHPVPPSPMLAAASSDGRYLLAVDRTTLFVSRRESLRADTRVHLVIVPTRLADQRMPVEVMTGVEVVGPEAARSQGFGELIDLRTCLLEQGLFVGMPQGLPIVADLGRVDPQPYPPEQTAAAWDACRPVFDRMVETQTGLQAAGEQFACLARSGYLELFASDADRQSGAFRMAAAACGRPSPVALTCDVHTLDADGALVQPPMQTGVTGFSYPAGATAPDTAGVGQRFTIGLTATSTTLHTIRGQEVLDHDDFVRVFTVAGARITSARLVVDDPAAAISVDGQSVSITYRRKDSPTPANMQEATLEVVASSAGTVTVTLGRYEATFRVRQASGNEIVVRTLCTGDGVPLASTTVR